MKHRNSDVPDYSSLLRLDGATYAVLGAGQGIGRQVALALAGQGARVVCVDKEASRLTGVLTELGDAAVGRVADITREDDVIGLVDFLGSHFGTLTGVVDIVGMAVPCDIADMTQDVWDQQFDVSLRHVMLVLRHAMPLMKGVENASFGFVSSVAAIRGSAHNSAYGAAKAALESLITSAAVEYGPLGIRVNAVSPGIIWTPRFAEILGDEGRMANEDNTPLGRIGEPWEIAGGLLFLASRLASLVTGQVLVIDGGVNAKFPYPKLNFIRR
ncbi:SDR family NAD(P)-dependent oxidoreductase [Rhodococcus wratislaviensis]|uniref:Putative oxidoreductase n=1 Tax=Rhodococcus wratislaviensis NBRC 100605 TaxID=1219028 RepID=X0PWH0_RHOWR|nr:SDR family oxidoreductase [Rhodococcus wratislaviensis]GAF47643.1 putative oxidoreductase [Rhodococcus wratislaviensis NBRC 100605]